MKKLHVFKIRLNWSRLMKTGIILELNAEFKVGGIKGDNGDLVLFFEAALHGLVFSELVVDQPVAYDDVEVDGIFEAKVVVKVTEVEEAVRKENAEAAARGLKDGNVVWVLKKTGYGMLNGPGDVQVRFMREDIQSETSFEAIESLKSVKYTDKQGAEPTSRRATRLRLDANWKEGKVRKVLALTGDITPKDPANGTSVVFGKKQVTPQSDFEGIEHHDVIYIDNGDPNDLIALDVRRHSK